MSRFVSLFSLLLINIISSQYDIDCDAVHCTFNVLNQQETAIFVCTENADSCTVNCNGGSNNCENGIVYSNAQSTIINCNSINSCKNMKVYCGNITPPNNLDSNFDGRSNSCVVHCRNEGACDGLEFNCAGDGTQTAGINICDIEAAGTNSFNNGLLKCDNLYTGNKCKAQCVNTGSCISSNIDCPASTDWTCECDGELHCSNIVFGPKQVVPTTSPVSSSPTMGTSNPTKIPTNNPIKSSSPTQVPSTSPVIPTTTTTTTSTTTKIPSETPTKNPTTNTDVVIEVITKNGNGNKKTKDGFNGIILLWVFGGLFVLAGLIFFIYLIIKGQKQRGTGVKYYDTKMRNQTFDSMKSRDKSRDLKDIFDNYVDNDVNKISNTQNV